MSVAPTPRDEYELARAMARAILRAANAAEATEQAARALVLPRNHRVLSVGKAGWRMAQGLARAIGEPVERLVITSAGSPGADEPGVLVSDHPLPTGRSIAAGEAALAFVRAGSEPLIALISGGASSLMIAPLPGITLEDYRDLTRELLRQGASIAQINTVRRAIDQLKGGGLARAMGHRAAHVLVLSDVPGDPLQDIGSGPLAPSATSADDAAEVLERAGLGSRLGGVLEILHATPRPQPFEPPAHTIVASNKLAVRAASDAAKSLGLSVVSERAGLTLDAPALLASLTQGIEHLHAGEALCWGGEWPVRTSEPGFGGRCQWLGLHLAHLARAHARTGRRVYALCLATDGVDGLTPAHKPPVAGVIIGPGTLDLARAAGVDVQEHDSYACFEALDPAGSRERILTGPTGTNVNDIVVAWLGA